MTYRFTSEALQDYADAMLYYLEEASATIADAFDREVDDAIATICSSPRAARPARKNRREWVLGRFPYSIVYLVEDNEVLVVALKHRSRGPEFWSRRMGI